MFQKHSPKTTYWTTINSCNILFDPWIVKTKYIFSNFFLFFIPFSTLYLFKINLSFSRFVYWFNSSSTSIMPSLNLGKNKKSSHGNMHITKQHICYTVELHCLYKNRSPHDARMKLMTPCFFACTIYVSDSIDRPPVEIDFSLNFFF